MDNVDVLGECGPNGEGTLVRIGFQVPGVPLSYSCPISCVNLYAYLVIRTLFSQIQDT